MKIPSTKTLLVLGLCSHCKKPVTEQQQSVLFRNACEDTPDAYDVVYHRPCFAKTLAVGLGFKVPDDER